MKFRNYYSLLLLSFHFYVGKSAFFINSDGATGNRKDKAAITDKINILHSISGSSESVIGVPQEDSLTSENDAATVVNEEEVMVDAVVIYSTLLPSNEEEKYMNGSNHSDKDDLSLLTPNEGPSIADQSLKIKVAESSNESELDESSIIGNNNISPKQNQQTDLVDGIPKIKPHVQIDKSETIAKSKLHSALHSNHHQVNLKAKTNKESKSNDEKTIKPNKELTNVEQAKKEPTTSGIDEESKTVIHSPLLHGKVHNKKSLAKSSKAETTNKDISSKKNSHQKTFSHKKNLVSHKNKLSDEHKNSTVENSDITKKNFKKDYKSAETSSAQEIVIPAETQLKKRQDQINENNPTVKQKTKNHEQRNQNPQKLNKLELPTSVQVSIAPQTKDVQNEKLKEPENNRLELSIADKESQKAKEELSIENKKLQKAKLELSSENKELKNAKLELSSEVKKTEKAEAEILNKDKELENNKGKLSSKDKEPEKAKVELSSEDKVPKNDKIEVSSKGNSKNKQENKAMRPHPIFLGNKTKQKRIENTLTKEPTDEQIIASARHGKSNSKDLTNAIKPTPNEIANKQVIDLEQFKIKQFPEEKKTTSEENSDDQADKNVVEEEDITIPEPMKSNNLAVIAISMTLILTTLLLTLVGVYFRKISLERRRYVGHSLLGTEDDMTLFNRETYHDDVERYESWNSYSH